MTQTTYTTYHPYLGGCGHEHTTIEAAAHCAHVERCERAVLHPTAHLTPEPSPTREVKRSDGRPLEENEREELRRIRAMEADIME